MPSHLLGFTTWSLQTRDFLGLIASGQMEDTCLEPREQGRVCRGNPQYTPPRSSLALRLLCFNHLSSQKMLAKPGAREWRDNFKGRRLDLDRWNTVSRVFEIRNPNPRNGLWGKHQLDPAQEPKLVPNFSKDVIYASIRFSLLLNIFVSFFTGIRNPDIVWKPALQLSLTRLLTFSPLFLFSLQAWRDSLRQNQEKLRLANFLLPPAS